MDIVILNSGPTSIVKGIYEDPVYRSLGAYKIAFVCRQNGYKVQVIDHITKFPEEDIIKFLQYYVSSDTKILALSTTFVTDKGHIPQKVINAISFIKDSFPKIKIVMGGYSTIASLRIKEFDTYCAITKYGEDTFLEVVNHVFGRGQEPKYNIELNYYTKKIIKFYNEPLIKSYKIQNDNFKFHQDDAIVPGETLPIEISRGCIFKCKFCNHLLLGRGKLDYLRSFDLIKEELIHNYENWGTKSYYVICDTFNDTEYKMIEWHKMISSLPFKIKYTAYLRADLLDKFSDVPLLLQESGLVSAFHGIESLNREASLSIGKGWSGIRAREYIPELYHNIWKGKIPQTLSFIVGLPGDTKENIYDTIKWYYSNNLYQAIFQTLWLTNNKNLKNFSEFELNAEKYGYTFVEYPNSDVSYHWKNGNWDAKEVQNFVEKEINPRLPIVYSSWLIAMLIGLGISENISSKKGITVSKDVYQNYLKKYKSILLKEPVPHGGL